MKELVVISGKGGSGKTSMVAALSQIANNPVLCDADVDAADLHLILSPQVKESHEFMAGHTARINPELCTGCGKCVEMCRWNAISADFVVDPIECEGCGVCYYFCEQGAVEFPENLSGHWYISDCRFGPMVHAKLGIAEENSGKLVSLVRKEAGKIAEANGHEMVITDGPPGVGCPVIAAIGGASAVLVVTEPSVSGRHDMERVVDLAAHFSVPAMVCINKYDLNQSASDGILRFAQERGVPFAGRVPFDPAMTQSMVKAQTLFEYDPDSPACAAVREVWAQVLKRI
ncbi:MAG: 4Fe-4S binding protein [Desulfobacteraceae bacterium]|nr:4Fe-4S binding protein [Desulfobacteraceae bacterium]